MHCYICDTLMSPEEIRPDPTRLGKFLPCGMCRRIVTEDLKADELTNPVDFTDEDRNDSDGEDEENS